ncbi:GL15583 [Drosophila persimilis]|uniref:pH-sensitive chloride channel 2 n=2 Tax=pseudoobscura subgroup TaxID=32358 RepID=A0A6I8V0V6_DROPS|nr:glycine receptor subunit alphaZ1 [Drosophila persimilis]XP_002135057.2 glycine receptor subunit alphaZ1 [Drosophila pseudoobscura]EDW33457.1 GL15583 [Drosophila persimilis]
MNHSRNVLWTTLIFGSILVLFQASIGATIDTVEDQDCPSLANASYMQHSQLIQTLTHVCRYDRLERPIEYDSDAKRLPIVVKTRIYVYFLQNLNSDLLQFKMHALLQLRFQDKRLAYKAFQRDDNILGQKHLSERLWLPHIFFANERESSILGTDEKDVLTSLSPEGNVILSTRMQASLYCWMNFKKFPFDQQLCSTVIESWMYNTSDLVLEWEERSPISFDPEMRLTEYNMEKFWHNTTIVHSDEINLRHGAFLGDYSSLSFTVNLRREIGFYLLDYYLPSMMIVAISWVSFWLQADASPPRIMLGTSTMLSFITLSSSQSKNLPKVSYIKVSEVWFLGCTFFIFGSLVEFAFVNTIWRRKENIELKKVNSKYIIKSTLTPRPSRRQMGGSLSNDSRARSCSSLDNIVSSTESVRNGNGNVNHGYNNYLTVHPNLPIIKTECADNVSISSERMSNEHIIDIDKEKKETPPTFTTMTPQEIAMWIDRRSRFLFPVMFLAFNALYWTFVYVL